MYDVDLSLLFWLKKDDLLLLLRRSNFSELKKKKVQGRDRVVVKQVAQDLGLDGSYIPRTYIEQIQLEKLVNDVMVIM